MTNVETTTETTKRKVADHEYLDAAGNIVDEEESAQGYRYKHLESQKDFTWQWADATDDERRMLAIFGAKTLATNETSAARNNSKGAASADDQMNAVKSRFDLIRGGTWLDRERGGGGFAIKPELLAQAINNVRQALGKAVTDVGELLKRIAEEPGYSAKARKVPEVAAEYARLAGRSTVTIDDL